MDAVRWAWERFFRRRSPAAQAHIEQRLVRLGLSLGEYMEIIEATLMATRPPLGDKGKVSRVPAAIRCARYLRQYADRKAVLTFALQAAAAEQQMLVAGALPDEARAARPACMIAPAAAQHFRVHQRIEELKADFDDEPG